MDSAELMKRELLRRGYSPRTLQTYLFCLEKFFFFCKKEPKKITNQDVKEYLFRLQQRNLSGSSLNVHLNALKFFIEEILGRRFRVNIRYSKVPQKMPVVLTQEEVTSLILAIENPKHKIMIQLLYGAGLRVSELVHLRLRDFEFSSK